jgi:hypothetical protein
MLMTEFAMMDPGPAGNSVLSRCCRVIARFFGFDSPPSGRFEERVREQLPLMPHSGQASHPELHLVRQSCATSAPVVPHKWRRHEQLLHRPTSTLPDEERQARQHAVRGLYAARAGALDAAVHHLTQAASCPDVNLCEIPGFWQLNRAAMMTAVHAYEQAGRLRDASALGARIRTRFRPRVLSPVPGNVTELPTRRQITLSSNS